MRIFLKIYDIVSLPLLVIAIWKICSTRGWLMEKKWETMKSMWEKEEDHGKSISFHVKPVAIPIPLPMPVAMPYMKAQPMKAKTKAKPWKAETKDIFWKMMIMKMMKGDKKCDKKCDKPKMCCPKIMMMKASKKGCHKCKKCEKCKEKHCADCEKGCSMPMMNSPMMCCDCSQMMAPMSGCDSGCSMSGGWPMMNNDAGCSCGGGGDGWPMNNGGCSCGGGGGGGGWPMMNNGGCSCGGGGGGWPMNNGGCSCGGGGGGGGWPDEEEEEEEEEQYEAYEPPMMMGWDTNNVPIYLVPKRDITEDRVVQTFVPSRKGDNSNDFYLAENLNILKAFGKGRKIRDENLLRIM